VSGPVLAALSVAALLALADWRAVARADRKVERITRPAVVAALIAATLLAGSTAEPTRALLLLALAASLAGDWLLFPPDRFTAGLVAFLVAQLAYLVLFLLGNLDPGLAVVGAGLAVALLVLVGRPILAGAPGAGMRAPLIAYFGAICLMAIAATATGSALAAAGAWLFVLSDAGLGWDRFVAPPTVTRGAEARRRLGVIVTYHAAQLLLTVAVLSSSLS
jgi:uncharacterized membrane protein YhhN